MTQSFDLPDRLPALNELIRAKGQVYGSGAGGRRGNAYATLKREWTQVIGMCIRMARLQPMQRVFLRFEWREPNKKRDPDNVAAGGRKLILDTLVAMQVLPNDGWANVVGWSDVFSVSAQHPGVRVELEARP